MHKIGIICAMEEELDSIIHALGLKCEILVYKGFTLYRAAYLEHELIFILSGIGKVNAALHTQYLIDAHEPDYIINIGVAGSLSPDLLFGDVVIAADLVHHDVDVQAFGIALGQIPRMNVFAFPSSPFLLELAATISHPEARVVVGRIASGDQFIDNKQKAEAIYQEFEAVACEMEGAAIAHTCYVNQVPFIVVRALSDMAGRADTAVHSFEQLKLMAANRSALVVKQLLDLI